MKNFFILLFSISAVYANSIITNGDIEYVENNYIKAISYYEKAYKEKHPKAKIKLIMCYIKLGSNFERIQNYNTSLNWYKKAVNLKSNVAKSKISKIYEKQANDYNRIKEYKTALKLYKKALKLGNNKVINKIKKIKKILSHQSQLKNDTRKLVNKYSPSWTKAIGRLIIPTKLEFITKSKYKTQYKKCSASLINLKNFQNTKVIVTASHCLTNYDKDAGKIRFIIKNSSKNTIQRVATIYKDSNYHNKKLKTNSDYAILILDNEIPTKDVKPFIVNKNSFLTLQKKYKNSFASIAGYSADIGEYGAKLSYDPKCKLNFYSKMYGGSDCSGFKGASGGPVVLTTIDENNNYNYNFVGVISHFKNRKFQKIYFSPHNIFFDNLIKAIRK